MDLNYRISVAVIYFLQMALLLYFYKATKDKTILHSSDVEPILLVVIRSSWVILVISSILLYIIYPAALKWGELNLSHTVRVIGIIVGIISDFLILWVLVSLGKNISAALKVRINQQLVTIGPYRYVRHPLYSVGIILFLSVTLVSSNWILGIVGICFQLFIMFTRTPLEEKMLMEHFGEEYRRYIEKTGAFFPRFRI